MGLRKIEKWMERNSFLVIVLFFNLMLGIAWAASEHIGARSTLDTMPADDDRVVVWDKDVATGYAQEVSVFRGANLNAIVNAETGVASPGITMYDINDANGTGDPSGDVVTLTGAIAVVNGEGIGLIYTGVSLDAGYVEHVAANPEPATPTGLAVGGGLGIAVGR